MTKQTFRYRKILIVGCGGAGKSTLAAKLGQKLGLPVVNLDKIWWLPDWQTRSEDEFDVLLQTELNKPAWIIEGNFYRTFTRRLRYSELCIFLDYPTELCLKSVYARAEKYKGRSRPDMTEGCPERIDSEFEQWILSFEKDVKPKMLDAMKASDVPYKIFTSRSDTDRWLDCLV